MKLHLDKKLFSDAVLFTAQKMGIPPEYVEKDYWVTLALHRIFNSNLREKVVFKGGTALSKCYGIIERFSEDIDLVVLRSDGESGNQLKKRLKRINELIEEELPEVEEEGITNKKGMIRKTAHSYSKLFTGVYGQVRDIIILESTWLGHYEPYSQNETTSFVGQMMIENGQENVAAKNGLLPFKLLVLKPERTICEKIMSLVRFSYTENPIDDLKMKVRHTYDLYKLLENPTYFAFFNSQEFEEMLLRVAKDDVSSFKTNNEWLEKHPSEALIFRDLDNVWNELQRTYNADFKDLVYGELPDAEDVYKTLQTIKERLVDIEWDIQV